MRELTISETSAISGGTSWNFTLDFSGLAKALSTAATHVENDVNHAITDVGSALSLSLNTTNVVSDITKAFTSFQSFLSNDLSQKIPVQINVNEKCAA